MEKLQLFYKKKIVVFLVGSEKDFLAPRKKYFSENLWKRNYEKKMNINALLDGCNIFPNKKCSEKKLPKKGVQIGYSVSAISRCNQLVHFFSVISEN